MLTFFLLKMLVEVSKSLVIKKVMRMNSAHRQSQAKCQQVQMGNIKQITFFLFAI